MTKPGAKAIPESLGAELPKRAFSGFHPLRSGLNQIAEARVSQNDAPQPPLAPGDRAKLGAHDIPPAVADFHGSQFSEHQQPAGTTKPSLPGSLARRISPLPCRRTAFLRSCLLPWRLGSLLVVSRPRRVASPKPRWRSRHAAGAMRFRFHQRFSSTEPVSSDGYPRTLPKWQA
jgi:hypothetical protein